MMCDFRSVRRFDQFFFIRWKGKWVVREAEKSKFKCGDRVEVQDVSGDRVLLTKYIGEPPGGRVEKEEYNAHTFTDAQAKRIAKIKSDKKDCYRTL